MALDATLAWRDEISTEETGGLSWPPRPVAGARRPASFSTLERQVIALAQEDTLASLEAPGLIERCLAFLFGLEPGRKPLADTRLETLRRAVVVSCHRHHLPDAHAAELRRQGFDEAQISAIERLGAPQSNR
ncbi:hypothetical protein [Sphingomonas morindae]|uniref:Uncharacterized protein n=1 Tax=Sphingomonas morindae TaxID=1541170 RepID=A0ABY4X8F0_9SPHN|nr:hypothetical protein [Sphingomonas morindae]USI72951.1 hypothetical protein LHA26_00250 [Sphingomonas morindae]